MNSKESSRAGDAHDEIPALIETLMATEQRLEELTGGEVDTVAGRDGRTFLLRRAQEQLRYSDAAKQAATLNELQVLFDLMPAMVWFKDTEDRILRVNQRVADIAGKSIEEIEGKPSAENYPQEAARHYEDDLEVIRSGQPKMGIIETIRNRRGEAVWIETDKVPHCDPDGKVIGVVVLAQDITERRRTDEKLRASEERFRLLAKATNDAIWDWDLATDALWWNDGIEKLFGYRREKVDPTIKSWMDCIHPQDFARVTEGIHHAIDNGLDFWTDEYRFRCQDASYAYVLDRGHIIRDAAGQGVRMIGGMTDLTERKRIEDSLRASQANMAIAQRIAHFGSWESDLSNSAGANALRWSDEMFRIAGYEPGAVEVSSDLFFRLVHPEDRESIRQAVATAIRERREYSLVHRLIRPDGETRVVQETAQIFFDQRTGHPAKIVGTAHDITERKQAETALRASEAEFRALSEAMPQIVWVTRPDGWCIYFNQQWMDYTGLNLEESLGPEWNKAVHPEDRQRAWEAWQQATATVGVYSLEYRLRRADGTYRWWLVRGMPQQDTDGNVLKWFGTCTDIHDLKEAELEISRTNRELRESDARFHHLADNITDVFWITSPDFNTMHYVSAGYELIWGRSAESLYAHPHQRIETILPEERKSVVAAFGTLMGTAPEVSIEYRIARPDGTIRWIHDRGFQVRDAHGKVIRLTGIACDITQRKQSEAEMEKAHRRLLEISRQAGMAEVATEVLHNVGNVLNSVTVTSSCVADSVRKSKATNLAKVVTLLREHEADLGAFLTNDPKGKQIPGYLAQLAEHLSAEQAGVLKGLAGLQKNIEHIKDIVTMQQNVAKVSGLTETLSVIDLVEDALKMNASAVAGDGMVVRREFENVPFITVEKHKVLQILVNLVRNAEQSCHEAGGPEQQLTLRVTNGKNSVRIAVADNGVGIPPENCTRIFAHGFTTKKSGHGFGLHSAALTAKGIGGSLSVHSDGPGQGATFTLELPYTPDQTLDESFA